MRACPFVCDVAVLRLNQLGQELASKPRAAILARSTTAESSTARSGNDARRVLWATLSVVNDSRRARTSFGRPVLRWGGRDFLSPERSPCP